MENKDNQFQYTYVAPTDKERREIERIREYYRPEREESDFIRLTKLDKRVRSIPTCAALTLGTIGTLIFGSGLAMVLEWELLTLGIAVSALGIVPVALAYPAYTFFVKRMKKKYGDEILQLLDKLLKKD